MQEAIAAIEHAIDGMATDPKAATHLRDALRSHLLSMMDLPAATSLVDALGFLKDEQRPEAGTAALIVRCLAVQGALPAPANSNQIARAIPSFVQRSLPDLHRYFDIDEKKQNYEKHSTLMGAHPQILQLLSPLVSTFSLERVSAHKQACKQALNNNCVRQYLDAFGHGFVSTTLETLFQQMASLNETNENLTTDLKATAQVIEDAKTFCDANYNFLTRDYFRPLVTSVEAALDAFKKQARSRLAAKLVTDLGMDGVVEKRQPLHDVGRRIRITVSLRNLGPATALSTSAVIVVDDSLALDCATQTLGNVSLGSFTLTFDAMVVEACESVSGQAEITWSEQGNVEESKLEVNFSILAQNKAVDWEFQEYEHPYSPSVAKGREFIGRSDKVKDLAKKVLRTPMESFYVTGQKRVGKTSLVLAATDFAKGHSRGKSISELYLLWGSIAHEDAKAAIEELGKRIAALLLGAMPENEKPSSPEFKGSIAPLTVLAEAALAVCPERKFVIIVDEFDEIHSELYVSGPLAETLFGNIRALTNYSNICLILVGGENMPFIMDRQGQKLNKLSMVSLDYYSRREEWDDFESLITTPTTGTLAWHDDAIDYVFRQTNGNPYFAKILCASVFAEAVKGRDADITFEEVAHAFDRNALTSDSPSFQHLWQDGIHKPIADREPDILRRSRVLVCVARTLRRGQDVTVLNVFGNRGMTTVTETEIGAVLHEFTRRNVMRDEAGVFAIRIPLFREWLKEVGIARLAHDVVTEELARSVQEEEDLAYVRPTEVADLTSRWPTYQGRQIGTDDVRAWLEQVDGYRQQRLLFKLLGHVTFYSEARVRELLRVAHELIRTTLPRPIIRNRGNKRDDLMLVYVDGEGKSGSSHASRFADENHIVPKSITSTKGFAKLMALRAEGRLQTNGIAVIDDIIASGRSLSGNLQVFVDDNEAIRL